MGITKRTRAEDDSAQCLSAQVRSSLRDLPASRRTGPRIISAKAAGFGVLLLLVLLSAFGATALEAQTYQITSASYGSTTLAIVPAGVNGATLTLTGTLPTAAQQVATPLLGCFYTGYGGNAGFPLSAPTGPTVEPLTVPAATIQAIPQTQFTAASGYSVTALVYIITADGACDGTTTAAVSNQFPVQVLAPSLGAYNGPLNVPQTNPSTSIQAAPLSVNIPAAGFLPSATVGAATTVKFGTFGSVTLAIPATATSSINVPVPPAFSLAAAGTTASLSICNTFGTSSPVCTTPTPAITLTVTALAASTGTVTASPTPVLVSDQTTLSAQFTKAASAGTASNLGAPSGLVSFTADGATVAPAPLVLDTTATFTTQTTALAAPAAPAPVITPAAGAYTGAKTITITDSVAGASIYYTQDGTTPTSSSTLYSGPFQIISSETINAIATAPGYLTSAIASAAYTITILPATQLAFKVQPANAYANASITPPIQVALEDASGTVVVNSSAAVTLAIGVNPATGTLSGTTTVNAVNGIATFPGLSINAAGNGYTLVATSGTLPSASSSAFNITPPTITLTVPATVPAGLVGIGATLNGSFTLSSPAPTGGLTVTLTSGTPANVTIAPATVTVAAGQTTGAFTFTGVAAGNSVLSASAPGYVTGTVTTTATAAQVSLGMIPNVAPAQMQSIALSLVTAAPAGGTTVTFTIADPTIATVTATSFVPAGQFTPAANPQVTGVLIGTTTVTANAPGYAPATRPVVVTVTAGFNPGTTNINLATATNTSLTISAPAPPGGIVFTLSSDSPAIATVPASVTVPAGATSVPIAITGVSAGSTTIRADSPGITEATGTVNVDSEIGTSTFTTGYNLEEPTGLYLPVSPSAPTTVTVTVADPTVAVISTSNTIAGQSTLSYPNTTSNYIGTIWIQGLTAGTTNINISAPGYTAGTIAVTVNPSGFAINSYFVTYSTTTYSGPTGMQVYPAILNSDLSYIQNSTLIPQVTPFTLSVTSSSPAIGTVTSPLTFQPNDTQEVITFQPVAVGTTTVTLGTPPAGFSVSTSYQHSVVTVTTPVISIGPQTTGVHLINSIGLGLPDSPPTPVTVTLTSSDPTIFTVSSSPTTVGTTSVTFPNTASYSVGTVYVQGQGVGTAMLTMSAPGYLPGTSVITVLPSGFFLGYPFNSVSTTTFSSPTGLNIYTSALDLTTHNLTSYNNLAVNPGVAPFTVGLTNSTPSVGTLSASSVTFSPGDSQHSVNFQPASAGTDTVTLVTPAGFTTAAQYQSVVATVTAPAITVSGQETGVNLENSISIYLPVAPPTGHPVNVTVTSSNPAIATLSTSATTVGTASVTFTNVTGTTVGTVYMQGQGVGTATITESAADSTTGVQNYTSGTNTLTVDQSGFTFYYGTHPPFTTTTFSSPTSITVYATSLSGGGVYNPNNLTLNPGLAPVTVVVSDSTPSVGTISSTALVFSPGDNNHSFNFQPVSAGTTTVAISTPAGYTTAPYVTGIVTVTAPTINVNSSLTGLHLEQQIYVQLQQTPPYNMGNGVSVTVTSSSAAIATLSLSPTVAGTTNGDGTSSVTFPMVTTTGGLTLYVQGQGLGTAQITATAAGYINGSNTITVYPSGFTYHGNPNDTLNGPGGSPSNQTVYACILYPGTLTIYDCDYGINPGFGSVSVPITSSDPSIATVVSPLVFGAGVGYVNASFQPVAAGTTTINIGTPTGFSTPSQYTSATVTVP